MFRYVRIMDVPNERSAHSAPTPKCGGVAIVLTFVAGVAGILGFGDAAGIPQRYYVGFVLSTLTVAIVSFYDDVTNRPFVIKLLTQLLAVAVVLASGIVIDEIALPWIGEVRLGWLAYPVSFLWIIGLTDAYNFMDGLDGLAAGVAVVASCFFLIITFSLGSTFVYVHSYTVLAGALGFLVFNFPPARIFMGDVGSATLGFLFATLAIIAARYDASHTSFMVTPLLLFTFIYDTALTFMRRLLAGEPVTQPHRTHLYQLCHRLGLSAWTISASHYLMCALHGLLALWMLEIEGSNRVLVFLPVLAIHIVYSVVVLRAARRAGLLAR
jgi:UDP-GlcNAc:undecaprenyl-phosphate GlcNAc-1-phosphate transferase